MSCNASCRLMAVVMGLCLLQVDDAALKNEFNSFGTITSAKVVPSSSFLNIYFIFSIFLFI